MLLALIVLGVLIGFLALHAATHWFAPTWGTMLVNAIALLGSALDMVGELPWTAVLEAKQAAAVMFAMAVGNMIVRAYGAKRAVGSA